MGDAEVQHQRHRARRVREVTREHDVPTSLTPAPNHLLRFYFVGCAKEVSNLINRPVVSLFGSRVNGTGCHMARGEESLLEDNRPGLISEMRSDLTQSTHGLIPEDPPRSVLFI